MAAIVECLDSNRNFSTPTQGPWERSTCLRTHQGTSKCKKKAQRKDDPLQAKRREENGSSIAKSDI